MAVGSVLQAGHIGLQRALSNAQSAAETIARPNLEEGVEELTEALVQLLQAEIQAHRQRAQIELETEREKLAQTEGASRAEIDNAMKRFEAWQSQMHAIEQHTACWKLIWPG